MATARKTLRIAGICALVLCVGVTTMGIVIAPQPLPQEAGEEWFPCMGHGCGCLNAKMCREHCCCFGANAKHMHRPQQVRSASHSHDATDGASVKITIQSADCSGRLGWSMAWGLAWDVTPMTMNRTELTPHRDDAMAGDDLCRGLDQPGVDPPPPRC